MENFIIMSTGAIGAFLVMLSYIVDTKSLPSALLFKAAPGVSGFILLFNAYTLYGGVS